MKDKYKHSTSQLFNFAQDSYLDRTSRPIYAMVFLLPFIIFYEVGTFCINTDILNQSQIRVVAFVWLQNLLESLGFGGKFAWVAPPLAVVVILIALQLVSGKRWRFWFGDIWRMAVECILLAVPLVVFVLFINTLGQTQSVVDCFDRTSTRMQDTAITSCSAVTVDSTSTNVGDGGNKSAWKYWVANIVTGIGAGIYEELVFRLILICVLMMLFENALRLDHKNSMILSVLISAILFSAHHHIDFFSGEPNPTDPFNLAEFAFRTIAGIYFAILFAIRGFGITAGTHAFYNIIAVFINIRYF